MRKLQWRAKFSEFVLLLLGRDEQLSEVRTQTLGMPCTMASSVSSATCSGRIHRCSTRTAVSAGRRWSWQPGAPMSRTPSPWRSCCSRRRRTSGRQFTSSAPRSQRKDPLWPLPRLPGLHLRKETPRQHGAALRGCQREFRGGAAPHRRWGAAEREERWAPGASKRWEGRKEVFQNSWSVMLIDVILHAWWPMHAHAIENRRRKNVKNVCGSYGMHVFGTRRIFAGNTPLDFAKSNGHTAVVKILEDAGAQWGLARTALVRAIAFWSVSHLLGDTNAGFLEYLRHMFHWFHLLLTAAAA